MNEKRDSVWLKLVWQNVPLWKFYIWRFIQRMIVQKSSHSKGQLGTIIWLDIFSHSQSAHLPQNHNVYTIHLIYSWPGQLSGTRIRSYLWAFLHNSEWITKKIEIRNQLVRLARTSGTAYSSIDLFYFIL